MKFRIVVGVIILAGGSAIAGDRPEPGNLRTAYHDLARDVERLRAEVADLHDRIESLTGDPVPSPDAPGTRFFGFGDGSSGWTAMVVQAGPKAHLLLKTEEGLTWLIECKLTDAQKLAALGIDTQPAE